MAEEKNDMNQKFQECLAGLEYPASKQQMIDHVQKTCGDEDVASKLKELPDQVVNKLEDLKGLLPGIHLRVDI